MTRWALMIMFAFSSIWLNCPASFALEKVKVGTGIKGNPSYFLPLLAATEKGYWKEQGVEGEWVPFNSSVSMGQAAMGGAIDLGIHQLSGLLQVAARGITIIGVAKLAERAPWYIWVLKQSRIERPEDLNGAKIGVSRPGGIADGYAKALAKDLGLTKPIRIVGVGGVREMVAALRTGAIDAVPLSSITMARLEYEGVARKIVDVGAHSPQSQDYLIVYAREEAVKSKPDALKRALKAMLEAGEFINPNPEWSVATIKKETGWPEPVSQSVYQLSRYSKDGVIDKEAIGKMRSFLIEYGLVSETKVPPVSQLYTETLLPVQ